jgi:ribonuclease BN (tRNA processing enzyme)
MSNHLAAIDLPEAYLYDGVDAFVCELAHFSLDDLAPYIEKARTDKLFLTHVYPDSEFEQIIGLEGKYPFEIVAPNDSDEFEI